MEHFSNIVSGWKPLFGFLQNTIYQTFERILWNLERIFRYAFSANRKPTILRKDNPDSPAGQPLYSGGLSSIDQKQLNAMYCKGASKTSRVSSF